MKFKIDLPLFRYCNLALFPGSTAQLFFAHSEISSDSLFHDVQKNSWAVEPGSKANCNAQKNTDLGAKVVSSHCRTHATHNVMMKIERKIGWNNQWILCMGRGQTLLPKAANQK